MVDLSSSLCKPLPEGKSQWLSDDIPYDGPPKIPCSCSRQTDDEKCAILGQSTARIHQDPLGSTRHLCEWDFELHRFTIIYHNPSPIWRVKYGFCLKIGYASNFMVSRDFAGKKGGRLMGVVVLCCIGGYIILLKRLCYVFSIIYHHIKLSHMISPLYISSWNMSIFQEIVPLKSPVPTGFTSHPFCKHAACVAATFRQIGFWAKANHDFSVSTGLTRPGSL